MCRAHTGDREGTRAWIRATGASSGMGTVSGEVAERTPGKRTREDRGCEAWRMSRPGRGDAGGTGWSRQQTPLKPRVEGDGDPLSPGTRLGVGGVAGGGGDQGAVGGTGGLLELSLLLGRRLGRRRPEALLNVKNSKKRQRDLSADYDEPLKCPLPHLEWAPPPNPSVSVQV